ncbi:hypothetical protein ACO0K9_17620 [Undibacterium sp. Ji50W]|uniref:hypothetical protein n=1 Tax=Undibacterium sp. Ji50W TaxID=3413041 RepID=UPI003BEF6738
MEQHQQDLSDPIAAKLRDTATMEKIMQRAVKEAVDKAQRLGFLPTPPSPTTKSEP